MKAKINWFEIPSTDFQRAIKFYSELLDTQFQEFHCDNESMAFFPKQDNGMEGAIVKSDSIQPGNQGVLISFHVPQLDITLEKAKTLGAKSIIPKTKIECEDRGYFAVIEDTEGNRLSFHCD